MTAIPAPAIIGPLGPAQLTCIRSWVRRGHRVLFVHLTRNRWRVPFLNGVIDSYQPLQPDEFMRAEGEERLATFLAQHGATAVCALSYNLIRRLHQLKRTWPREISLWAVDRHILPFLESKRDQFKLAQKVGFQVARTIDVTPESIAGIPSTMFPLVLRPNRPGSIAPAFKVELASDRNSLSHFFNRLSRLQEPLVGQPFIYGKNYVVHGARCSRSGRMIHVGFEVPSMFEGVALTMRQSELPAELLHSCERFSELSGLMGIYHFDFRRDQGSGKYHFLEVNGRLGGTTAKVYRLGFDEPGLMADAFLGNKLAKPELDPQAVVSNRQAAIKAAWHAIRDKQTVFDYPKQNFTDHLADLGMGMLHWRDDIYSVENWRTSIAYLIAKFTE
jgi:hypothetical protein